MPKTFEALTVHLRALEGRDEIRDLKARYEPLADAGDAACVAAHWQEAGVYSVGVMGSITGTANLWELVRVSGCFTHPASCPPSTVSKVPVTFRARSDAR